MHLPVPPGIKIGFITDADFKLKMTTEQLYSGRSSA